MIIGERPLMKIGEGRIFSEPFHNNQFLYLETSLDAQMPRQLLESNWNTVEDKAIKTILAGLQCINQLPDNYFNVSQVKASAPMEPNNTIGYRWRDILRVERSQSVREGKADLEML